MSNMSVNVIALILVVIGIVLGNNTEIPAVVGFLFVTTGFTFLVVRKWMDKQAPRMMAYIYTILLLFYVYSFVTA